MNTIGFEDGMAEAFANKAKETAIVFGIWLLNSDYIRADDDYWRKRGTDTFKSTAQLFEQFNRKNAAVTEHPCSVCGGMIGMSFEKCYTCFEKESKENYEKKNLPYVLQKRRK